MTKHQKRKFARMVTSIEKECYNIYSLHIISNYSMTEDQKLPGRKTMTKIIAKEMNVDEMSEVMIIIKDFVNKIYTGSWRYIK